MTSKSSPTLHAQVFSLQASDSNYVWTLQRKRNNEGILVLNKNTESLRKHLF